MHFQLPLEVDDSGQAQNVQHILILGHHLTDTFDHASKSDTHGNLILGRHLTQRSSTLVLEAP